MAQLRLSQDDQGWVQIGLKPFPSATSRDGAKGAADAWFSGGWAAGEGREQTHVTAAESASGNLWPQWSQETKVPVVWILSISNRTHFCLWSVIKWANFYRIKTQVFPKCPARTRQTLMSQQLSGSIDKLMTATISNSIGQGFPMAWEEMSTEVPSSGTLRGPVPRKTQQTGLDTADSRAHGASQIIGRKRLKPC